jgi:outer membrane protein
MRSYLKSILVFVIFIVSFDYGFANDSLSGVWTLPHSIKYAQEHNFTIQQNELNERLMRLRLKQSQLAQLPNLNVSPSYGISHGRSIDPTTNQFVVGSYNFLSAGASANVLLFGWFSQRNMIAKNKFNLAATQLDNIQFQNDLSLNVATGYLRILLAKEQIEVQKKQTELSWAQLVQTKKFAEAGRVPELNVAQLEAQLANDSAAYIGAVADYEAAIIDIKALLNLDFEEKFQATVPPIEVDLQPYLQYSGADEIFKIASEKLPNINSSKLKYQAAKAEWKAARASLYPQLSMGGQLGSNWTSTYQQINGYGPIQYIPTGYYAELDGRQLDVYQPYAKPNIIKPVFFDQLNNNFRQTISLTLNIPIFNGWQAQLQKQQAAINVASQEINIGQVSLKLKQDIYKAYNDVKNAIQKHQAAKQSSTAAQRAYDFAVKRYELGLTNTVEYLSIQNNLYKAEGNFLSTKYDLMFKLKVIEYYVGHPMNL